MTGRPTDAVIVDSGGANLASLQFALQRLGATSMVTADPETIRRAQRVVLPGVGSAADAMARLGQAGLDRVLPALRQPVLGICLGMQLLYDRSEEGATACLGIVPGTVQRLEPAPGRAVPHMGWNRVHARERHALLDGIDDGAHFYFVHSYAAPVTAESIALTDYGADLTAIVRQGNFLGTQFHPERSGPVGARLLANFLRLAPCS
ncbi:MAG: Imidazole glycerol phosphate synthase subunit HisH [Steroidobacteraceae bacterium]|nr:Imidazole glycerol phosphate synthase subunit HisH [Steroidobacteraceae bacterium]